MNWISTCAIGIIIMCWFGSDIHAQGPVLRQFTIKDGLPGSMVYYSMQDQKGYIWSATDRGVTRFDGHQFKLFTMEDGLPSNDVWRISEDANGRLWMSTFTSVCYYENGVFKTLAVADSIQPEMIQHYINPLGHFISFDGKKGRLLFVDEQSRLQPLDRDNSVFRPDGFLLIENKYSAPLFKKMRTQLNIAKGDSLIAIDQSVIVDHGKSIQHKIKTLRPFQLKAFLSLTPNRILFLIEGALWLADDQGIRPVDKSQFLKQGKSDQVIQIKRIASNGIWIKTEDEDYVVDTNWQPLSNFEFLSDLFINNFLIDRQGNLWLSTRQGLFFLNQKAQSSRTYDIKEKGLLENIELLTINEQHEIWGLGTKGHLYHLEQGNQLKLISSRPLVESPSQLQFGPKGNLWIGGNRLVQIPKKALDISSLNQRQIDHPILDSRAGAVKKIHVSQNNKMLVSAFDQIYTLDDQSLDKTAFFFSGRFYGLAGLENGNYWIAGKKGLKQISAEGKELAIPQKEQYPIFDLPINDIVVSKDQHLWLAIDSKGLYRFDGNQLEPISELDNILIQSLYVDTDDRVWVATNQGLAKIMVNRSPNFSYRLEWYTEIDGLASNDIKAVIVDQKQIFVATEKGLTVLQDIPRNNRFNNIPFYFSKLYLNGKDTSIHESYDLHHSQNKLLIEYQYLDYQNMGNMAFQYQLEGVDQDWVNTTAFQKEYPLLPPGNYTFRLRRKPEIASFTSPVLVMRFKINPPWWKRGWFLFACFLSFLTAVYFLLQIRINQVVKKAEAEKKLHRKYAEAELKALQAQMNPHFIFNALHAIQDFIFKKDERVANRYIVKFSRLMRLFLESSKEKFIILEDEIQLLQFYIELEKLRFEDQFDFEINYDENLPLSMIEIPSMLLQPFVENAINHGLIHRRTPGKLTIAFTEEYGKLHCRIEDNGIGRKKAMEIKEKSIKSYKSRGMQLAEERQKIWSELGNASVHFSINDLHDENGKACGTRIDVFIEIGN